MSYSLSTINKKTINLWKNNKDKLLFIIGDSYSGKPNPHAWMGLNEALIYVDNIVNALSYYDKKNSELYSKAKTGFSFLYPDNIL